MEKLENTCADEYITIYFPWMKKIKRNNFIPSVDGMNVKDIEEFAESYAALQNKKLIGLLDAVLKDNYDLTNKHEIAPELRNEIEMTID